MESITNKVDLKKALMSVIARCDDARCISIVCMDEIEKSIDEIVANVVTEGGLSEEDN